MELVLKPPASTSRDTGFPTTWKCHTGKQNRNGDSLTITAERILPLTEGLNNLRVTQANNVSIITTPKMLCRTTNSVDNHLHSIRSGNSLKMDDEKILKSSDVRNGAHIETCTNTTSQFGGKKPCGSTNSINLSWGYGPCKLPCFESLNKPSAVLSLLCISSFVKGFIMNGIINVNMSTIEKRFGLTSSQAGWIASIHDLTAAPVALIVSYIGAVGYKMRWIGFGLFCLSIGSFIIITPHFAAERYKWQHNLTGLCSNKTESSRPTNTSPSYFLYVFLVGRLFHGIGSSILHTLGISCIDDCVDPKNAPMYMGIMLCFGTLGPAIGFLVGGQFLKIFVDINSTEMLISEEDPQWIGAWWMSFLISGVTTLLIVPILLVYQKELPVPKEITSIRRSECHQNTSQKRLAQSGFGTKIKDLPMTAYLLLWNPSFLFVTLTFTAEAALLDGVSTFLPKFLESQYRRTPSRASLLSGIVSVPGGAGGQLLGGYICKKYGLKITQMTRLAIVCFIISLVTWGVVWIECDGHNFADVIESNEDYKYPLNTSKFDLTAVCNMNCFCNTEYYEPVCGSNGKLYFSPCHAGCVDHNNLNKSYSNCSCIDDIDQPGIAKKGVCKDYGYCYQLLIFLPFLMITLFLTFVARTPLVAVVLRCIPDNQKTFGLGVNHFIRRLLGSLPGPLLFGEALDRSCKVWKRNKNDDSSCWLYNSFDLSFNFFLLFIILRILSILFLVCASCLYKPPDKVTRQVNSYDNPAISQLDEMTSL